jgi:hypothetical protein
MALTARSLVSTIISREISVPTSELFRMRLLVVMIPKILLWSRMFGTARLARVRQIITFLFDTHHVFILSLFREHCGCVELRIDAVAEIAKCYDLELKAGALQQHFNRNIKPNVKLIQDARKRGENPIGVILLENVRSENQPGKR